MTHLPRHGYGRSFSATLLCLCIFATSLRAQPAELVDMEPAVGPSGFFTKADRYLQRALEARRARFGVSEAALDPGVDYALGGWNEQAIAVNPTDPMNIAYASLFELRVSTDGGMTWESPVRPAMPERFEGNGDPSIAFDAMGRLFWTYLGLNIAANTDLLRSDILISQCDPNTGAVLPNYPVNITSQIGLPGTANSNDKQWLAADFYPGSPYANRLYLVWSRFSSGTEYTLTTYSADQGQTWSAPVQLGAAGSGSAFHWPSHIAVAPNGHVFAADHRQPTFSGGAPNGISGYIAMFRSTDGGANFFQVGNPFGPGESDMTFNVQHVSNSIPNTQFLLQGGVQPWILPDPNEVGRLYVVACDDPDNDVTSGDAANVYISRSTDDGATWSTPKRVDDGPGTTFQVMPSAGIDPSTGVIAVQYYDNRNGATNADGNYLLDLYATVSHDGGDSFSPSIQINDEPFDPDAGARCRYNCGVFLSDVFASGGNTAFVAASNGDLLYFNGSTWSTVASTGPGDIRTMWGASSSDIFFCGANGTIFHYDGVTASPQASPTGEHLLGLAGSSSSDLYAVGSGGTVLHYNGISWSSLIFPGPSALEDAWMSPTGTLFVSGLGGTVYSYDGSWTDLSPDNTSYFYGVWGTSDTDVYVTDDQGTVLHWDGVSWSSLDTGISLSFGVWGTSSSNFLVIGWGQMRRYDGLDWTEEAVSEHLLYGIDGAAANDIFVVGEDGEVAHYDGTGWTRLPNPLTGTDKTLRIGEYIGIAGDGGRFHSVWCGNTQFMSSPLDQQSLTDSFDPLDILDIRVVSLEGAPSHLILEAPQPNPSRHAVSVSYSLPKTGTVDLALVDAAGRRVATLVHGPVTAGRHIVSWNSESDLRLTPGVYFLRLDDGLEIRTQKFTYLH